MKVFKFLHCVITSFPQIFMNLILKSIVKIKIFYKFFYELFFYSAPVLLNFFMNWVSDVGLALFNAYNHHAEVNFVFSIIVYLYVSRPRSITCHIYAIYFSFSASFSLSLIIQPHVNRHTCFFVHLLEYLLLFLDDNVDEESE